VPYAVCSTTGGVLSLDPYVLRFDNGTPGEIYGNGGTFCFLGQLLGILIVVPERFNYDPSAAFDYNTYPVTRFVNEFGFVIMP
jgi:beta-mannosidase